MAANKVLLDYLADSPARSHHTVHDLCAVFGVTSKVMTRMLFALQKLGVVKIHESGGMIDWASYRHHKVDRHVINATLAIEEVTASIEEQRENDRLNKLKEAARLLEDAGEITLAILVLDAMEGKERDLSLYIPDGAKRKVVRLPSGLEVRQLTDEEVARIDW